MSKRTPPAANQSRRASYRTNSFNPDARTFEAVLSTGAQVDRVTYVEELALTPDAVDTSRVAAGQMKLLDSHRSDSIADVLGSVKSVRFEAGTLIGAIQLADTPRAREIEKSIADGTLSGISIGYRVAQWTDASEGASKPTWRADQWELLEASLVAIPADAGASVRSLEPPAPPMPTTEDIAHLRDLLARGIDCRAFSSGLAKRGIDAAFLESECSRADTLRKLCVGTHYPAALAAEHIRLGTGPNDFRATLIDALAALSDSYGGPVGTTQVEIDFHNSRNTHVNHQPRNDETYSNPAFARRCAEDAIFSRLTGQTPPDAARRFMSVTLANMGAALAECRGERVDWLDRRSADWAQRSFGQHTTSDLPILLLGAGQRTLAHQMAAMADGIEQIATVGTLPDFRVAKEVSTSQFPDMKPVGESGEIQFGSVSENGESISIASYGRGISFSFAALINDDTGALALAIRNVAVATVNLKSSLIFAALSKTMSDTKALFHADHGNLATAGAAPDETTLSDGRKAMRTQTGIGGQQKIGITPAILVVGAALETAAEKLLTTIQATTTADTNVFAGRLRLAVSREISDNAWFLAADPGIYPGVRFLTLAGYESPRLEEDRAFDRLGATWRVHWHVGASPIDWRPLWKNPGA